MKYLLTSIFFFLLSYASETPLETITPEEIKKNWKIVWQDEFNNEEIDTTKWRKAHEWVRQKGFCQWSDEDSYTDKKGNLILRMRQGKNKIRCGAIFTRKTFLKKFGYFEIRCKIPIIDGGRSAFWLRAKDNEKQGGENATEINIFESIRAHKGRIQHGLLWDMINKKSTKNATKSLKGQEKLYDNKYHTFAVLWTEKSYNFYIDNKLTWKTNAGGVLKVEAFIYLTMEASKWEGNISKAKLPQYFMVDYVRVYDLP